ncbi:Isoleucine--tRNA ligase [Geodia barretti]|uniref:isoleucine--tRNA ligase n=1 Tax=Geodia barretti TaxID=519541 RepID=A0AA35W5G7_GEOBA|nr:Isoleucine--tRNA ligase [Geodia barretti]
MFEVVSSRVSFPDMESEVLRYWQDHDVFRRSVDDRPDAPLFMMYEGPPTANGSPGIHHVLARVFKDVISRYRTMKGCRVIRKGGWDTHGLPVELEIEKELGLRSKRDIEEYGIAEFNQRCRESVFRYVKEWEVMTDRIGYWVDMDDPYVTLDNDYIETGWWILKELWDRGLLYEDQRGTPHCPRCVSSLSSHEVALGYRENTPDPSVFVKFEATRWLDGTPPVVPTYLLAWTTTPWTLPGNTALAVSAEAEYSVLEITADTASPYRMVVATDRLAAVSVGISAYGSPISKFTRRDSSSGNTTVELLDADGYDPHVVAADFVSMDDGSGIVHIAPAFGDEDLGLGREKELSFVQPVDLQGIITAFSELAELSGAVVDDLDLHRPYVDNVTWNCGSLDCDGTMRRIPEVMDAWFDSGMMPLAQWHYPFENTEIDHDGRLPADYICEAVDQTRGWFYSLHALSTLLKDDVAYRNVICLGLILDGRGRKMSKRLGNVVDPITVDDNLDHYNPTDAGRRIQEFIDILSNWYVRRSRRRFWKSESDTDKLGAYATLYNCLTTVAKLMAPLAPFVAEQMYRNLEQRYDPGAPDSVHLAVFPSADVELIDRALMDATRLAMRVASMGRAARSKAKLKVRQPLASVVVRTRTPDEAQYLDWVSGQILEELNIKELHTVGAEPDLYDQALSAAGDNAEAIVSVEGFSASLESGYMVAIDTRITPELADEGLARELAHRIQNLRKNARYEITDRIITYYQGPSDIVRVMDGHQAYIMQETLSEALLAQEPDPDASSESQSIEGMEVVLGVRRVTP